MATKPRRTLGSVLSDSKLLEQMPHDEILDLFRGSPDFNPDDLGQFGDPLEVLGFQKLPGRGARVKVERAGNYGRGRLVNPVSGRPGFNPRQGIPRGGPGSIMAQDLHTGAINVQSPSRRSVETTSRSDVNTNLLRRPSPSSAGFDPELAARNRAATPTPGGDRNAARRAASRGTYPDRRVQTLQDVLAQAQEQRESGLTGDQGNFRRNDRAQRLAENDVIAAGGQIDNPFFRDPIGGGRLGGSQPDVNIPGRSGNTRESVADVEDRFEALGGGRSMAGFAGGLQGSMGGGNLPPGFEFGPNGQPVYTGGPTPQGGGGGIWGGGSPLPNFPPPRPSPDIPPQTPPLPPQGGGVPDIPYRTPPVIPPGGGGDPQTDFEEMDQEDFAGYTGPYTGPGPMGPLSERPKPSGGSNIPPQGGGVPPINMEDPYGHMSMEELIRLRATGFGYDSQKLEETIKNRRSGAPATPRDWQPPGGAQTPPPRPNAPLAGGNQGTQGMMFSRAQQPASGLTMAGPIPPPVQTLPPVDRYAEPPGGRGSMEALEANIAQQQAPRPIAPVQSPAPPQQQPIQTQPIQQPPASGNTGAGPGTGMIYSRAQQPTPPAPLGGGPGSPWAKSPGQPMGGVPKEYYPNQPGQPLVGDVQRPPGTYASDPAELEAYREARRGGAAVDQHGNLLSGGVPSPPRPMAQPTVRKSPGYAGPLSPARRYQFDGGGYQSGNVINAGRKQYGPPVQQQLPIQHHIGPPRQQQPPAPPISGGGGYGQQPQPSMGGGPGQMIGPPQQQPAAPGPIRTHPIGGPGYQGKPRGGYVPYGTGSRTRPPLEGREGYLGPPIQQSQPQRYYTPPGSSQLTPFTPKTLGSPGSFRPTVPGRGNAKYQNRGIV